MPLRLVLFSLPLAGLLSLGGCASITEEECVAGDWARIGFEDGTSGRPADFLAKHAETCAEVGVVPDQKAWSAGRQQGLGYYCTPQNAYDLGRQGRPVAQVCPTEVQFKIEEPNDYGRRYYSLGQDIDDVRREMRAIDLEIARLKPGDPSRSMLLARRTRLSLEANLLRSRQTRYSRWP